MNIIKRVALLLIVIFLTIAAIVFVISRQIEGNYDSPIIPALGDTIRLKEGKILYQTSPNESWNTIGTYSRKNGSVDLVFTVDWMKGFSITVYPTMRGLKPIKKDKGKINPWDEYVLTRAVFDLNGSK